MHGHLNVKFTLPTLHAAQALTRTSLRIAVTFLTYFILWKLQLHGSAQVFNYQ